MNAVGVAERKCGVNKTSALVGRGHRDQREFGCSPLGGEVEARAIVPKITQALCQVIKMVETLRDSPFRMGVIS